MRTQYPDLVWGAIASSGKLKATAVEWNGTNVSQAVTHAQIDFPQYYDPIQKYGPEECITALQTAVGTIDALLDMSEPVPSIVKGLFGLRELEDDDFASTISASLGRKKKCDVG
jgi:hypothetical protein